ncbi:MAG: hypothetical protein RJA70_3777 [Pseudomonadota bacterium]
MSIHKATLATALVISFCAGCASGPPLVTEKSTSDIHAAEAVGAEDVPRASLHLQLAKEGLDRAKVLAAEGDDEEAASYMRRSEADAELALALSREDTERAEATAAIERVRALRRDNTQAND